jgi:hypothetical protein
MAICIDDLLTFQSAIVSGPKITRDSQSQWELYEAKEELCSSEVGKTHQNPQLLTQCVLNKLLR